jgi:hypothetical protein
MSLLAVLTLLLLGGGVYAATATLEGTLQKSSGDASPNEELLVVNASTGEEVAVTTDNDGQFSVQLSPGNYQIYRQDEDGQTLLSNILVEEGETRELNLKPGVEGDASLAAIREYEIGVTESSTLNSQNLSDLINPFPAKKQGRFYGSIYEFHRNDNLDAPNYFDPPGEPLPEYKRNQFGFTLGAQLTRSIFMFGSYDGLRINQGSTLLSHVPTPAMKGGDFSELDIPIIDHTTGLPFPGNIIPADRISPVAKRLLDIIPVPNRDDPDRNYVNNDPLVRNHDHLSARTDIDLNARSKLFIEYVYTRANRVRVHNFPTFNSDEMGRDHEASVSYNWSASERLLTFAKIEFDRGSNYRLSRNAGNLGLLESLGIAGLNVKGPLDEGYPAFNLSGYTSFGDRSSPESAVRNRLTLDTSLTYVKNNHTFRAGIEFTGRQLNGFRSDGLYRGSFSYSGTYSGDGFADFLLGTPDSAFHGLGSDRADLRRNQWEFSFRDQWKVRPNLSFTYGLTYRFIPPYHSIADNVSGFYPLLFEPPVDGEIIIAGSERASELGFDGAVPGSLIFPDMNDWSPYLGLSLSPMGTNQMVIRASYSIWYDPPGQYYFTQTLTRNYPFYFVESAESLDTEPTINIEDPFESGAVPEMTMRGMEPHLKNGYGQYWRLAVNNELARNWNLELAYVGRKGSHDTRMIPGNVPLPAEGPVQERRPNPGFGRFSIVNDGGSFTGHSFDVTAQKRLASGLSLRSGIEWNRFLSDEFWGDPSNPRNLRAEKATSNWVPQRRFFLNYIVDLPLTSLGPLQDTSDWVNWALEGWRLSGITEIRDGRAFSVTLPGDPNNDGVYGDRPDRLASGVLPSSARSIDHWFDTTAFAEPAPYSFGNAGRNILTGPGYQAWDVSVIKQTRFRDGDLLEFRIEFFNALNNVNFHQPESSFGTDVFGKIFGAARAREIEIALKYSF